MIVAFDTSSFVAYASGENGRDVELLDAALEGNSVMIPPMVLTELLSDPKLPRNVERYLLQIPLLALEEGVWERAGRIRRKIFSKKRKGSRLRARLADALIAQCCIDHAVPLITRDTDFRHFEQYAGLELL